MHTTRNTNMPAVSTLCKLSPAVTKAAAYAVSFTLPTDFVVDYIIKLCANLIQLSEQIKLFGSSDDDDPFHPSLRTLYTRLQYGYLVPNVLPSLSEEYIQASTQARLVNLPIEDRDLSDFEDVYYALLARLREMHQYVQLRIVSGFDGSTKPVIHRGINMTELSTELSNHWNVLNEPSWAKAMDDAIRRAKSCAVQADIWGRLENQQLTMREADMELRQHRVKDLAKETEGLDWTPDWLPAFVHIKLNEKYRIILKREKEVSEENEKELKGKIKALKEDRSHHTEESMDQALAQQKEERLRQVLILKKAGEKRLKRLEQLFQGEQRQKLDAELENLTESGISSLQVPGQEASTAIHSSLTSDNHPVSPEYLHSARYETQRTVILQQRQEQYPLISPPLPTNSYRERVEEEARDTEAWQVKVDRVTMYTDWLRYVAKKRLTEGKYGGFYSA